LTTMKLPSSSSLGELSSEIVNMKSLTFLSVGKCDGLEELPIGKLTTLTTLSLGKSMVWVFLFHVSTKSCNFVDHFNEC
jgi:hypothetical protein